MRNQNIIGEIPKLHPIKTRVRLPVMEDWGPSPHNEQPQDPRIQWEVDLHNTLTAVRYLLDENKVLGLLSGNTLAILRLAKTRLESEFPGKIDHQDEEPF